MSYDPADVPDHHCGEDPDAPNPLPGCTAYYCRFPEES